MTAGVRRERAGPRRAQGQQRPDASLGTTPGLARHFPLRRRHSPEQAELPSRPWGGPGGRFPLSLRHSQAARLRAESAQSRDAFVTNQCAFLGYPPPAGGWGTGCLTSQPVRATRARGSAAAAGPARPLQRHPETSPSACWLGPRPTTTGGNPVETHPSLRLARPHGPDRPHGPATARPPTKATTAARTKPDGTTARAPSYPRSSPPRNRTSSSHC